MGVKLNLSFHFYLKLSMFYYFDIFMIILQFVLYFIGWAVHSFSKQKLNFFVGNMHMLLHMLGEKLKFYIISLKL